MKGRRWNIYNQGNGRKSRTQDLDNLSSFDIRVSTPCSIVNSHSCTFDLPISTNSCLRKSLACWIASSLRFFTVANVAAALLFDGGMGGAERLGTGLWRWSDAVVKVGNVVFEDGGRVFCCEVGISDAPCEGVEGGSGVLVAGVSTDSIPRPATPGPCDNSSKPGNVGNSTLGKSDKCGG